jgi:hypothetical protein
MVSDPMWNFLGSGAAHAYYGLIGAMAISLYLLFALHSAWAGVTLALAAGVFVDLWVHQYLH